MFYRKDLLLGGVFGAVLLSLITAGSTVAQAPSSGGRFVPGRILVKFRPEVTPDRVQNFLRSKAVQSRGVIANLGVHVLDLPPFVNEAALAQSFREQAEVEFADVDRVLSPSTTTPNDPLFDYSLFSRMGLPNAWDITTGSSGVIIAFVDTGVDGTHEDLASKMVPGWNIVDNNSNTMDAISHGTAAAATAAAATNNGIGMSGICWNCRIMPVRVSTYSLASVSDIAKGIVWAADHGARVVNIGYAVTDDPAVSSAVQYLWNKGGVAVAPAGNEGVFNPNPDNPYIVTVGSVNIYLGTILSWSNPGNNLDLVAHYCNDYVAYPGNQYSGYVCGTSISAAFVSGVAGLLLSKNPNLSPADVKRILQESADDLGASGWDSTFGWGSLNAARAVSGSVAPLAAVVAASGAVFRGGLWVIDANRNWQWDGSAGDRANSIGQAGDIAIVGDWNGDGRTKIGVFRNGLWLLDYNGNGVWDGPGVDMLGSIGQAGDIPVVGDWNGDGRKKIGIFRSGLWVLDYNGNGQWDGPGMDMVGSIGQSGDTPVVGDWNGDGRAKVGIFRSGLWVLDYNGNGQWDGGSIDRVASLGQGGDIPVLGDWNGTHFTKIGIFRSGLWVIDYNGNGQWDGSGTDRVMSLGQTGDQPVTGNW